MIFTQLNEEAEPDLFNYSAKLSKPNFSAFETRFFKACAKSSSLHKFKPVTLRCTKSLKHLVKSNKQKSKLDALKRYRLFKRMVYTAMGGQFLNITVVCPYSL